MATLIQICASENDLFGLDGDGLVYQYNFNTRVWMRLGRGRRGYGDSPLADDGDGDRAVVWGGRPRLSRWAAPSDLRGRA